MLSGAILQCADGISTSLSELLADPKSDPTLSDLLKENISSAETIALCAQHQKSIVDEYVQPALWRTVQVDLIIV